MTANPRYTTFAPTINSAFACAVARMDAEAEVAMADFKAAQAVLYPVSASGSRPISEKLPKKDRRRLKQRCAEASFRVDALAFAMSVCPAQSKRGLSAHIRALGNAAMRGDTDHAERLVAVLCDGVEGLVPDDII